MTHAPREGSALPASLCAQRGQTREPLGRALSAVLKEALGRPPPPTPPAATHSQVPGPSARPTPRRQAWAAA